MYITGMKNQSLKNSINNKNEKTKSEGQGLLKMLTSKQMLSGLPITLAQLKAGNNSEKLINEIRQLLYSLHRSKTLTEKIYKHFINTI